MWAECVTILKGFELENFYTVKLLCLVVGLEIMAFFKNVKKILHGLMDISEEPAHRLLLLKALP
jgi:hypothetical protein